MKSVFVVEDDQAVGDTIRAILEDSRYAVTIVDGAGTVPFGTSAALVITDLMSRTGYDSASAIRQVREVRLRTGAPVLVLTAHGEAQLDSGLAGEANAVMTKPFQLDELLDTVQRLAV